MKKRRGDFMSNSVSLHPSQRLDPAENHATFYFLLAKHSHTVKFTSTFLITILLYYLPLLFIYFNI